MARSAEQQVIGAEVGLPASRGAELWAGGPRKAVAVVGAVGGPFGWLPRTGCPKRLETVA